MGTELGESRSAATAMAPAPDGAGAHADDEPVASGGPERRSALQEETVSGSGTKAVGGISASSWASRRRQDLLELLDRLNPTIAALTQAIEQEVEKCPAAQRLMTHPGVGPLTALAF